MTLVVTFVGSLISSLSTALLFNGSDAEIFLAALIGGVGAVIANKEDE